MVTQTQTTTADAAAQQLLANTSIITGSDQLPDLIVESSNEPLVDRSQFSAIQNEAVQKIVEAFSMKETVHTLEYASGPQRNLSAHLDALIGGMTVEEAGAGGELAIQLTDSIDMMQLNKVREQLSGDAPGWWARFMELIGLYKNYLKAFYAMKQPLMDKFDAMETRAANEKATISAEAAKLDKVVEASFQQMEELKLYIAAGEDILARDVAEFETLSKEALDLKDDVKIAAARDFRQSIVQFDVRFLRVKQAYVEASAQTIPEIRQMQEAMKIEIQNIVDGVLFSIPKLKKAVIKLHALSKTKSAQEGRKKMDEVDQQLEELSRDVGEDVVREAKKSQGDALERAERLDESVSHLENLIREMEELEKVNAGKRVAATEMLTGTRNRMRNTLNETNMDAVKAGAGIA